VPTCDGIALPKGTLFITDVGMTGNIDSVLGVKKEIIIDMFLTARNQKFEWADAGRQAFRSVLFDTQSKAVIRIDKLV
jgi:calcineurin-like phosphoesterase